jgi:hypothetical protein
MQRGEQGELAGVGTRSIAFQVSHYQEFARSSQVCHLELHRRMSVISWLAEKKTCLALAHV